jgi:elongator complex protein 2
MSITENVSCRMLHHGAAANSSSKAVICIPSRTTSRSSSSGSEIVYASHAILNVARSTKLQIGQNSKQEAIWNVYQTLRTKTKTSASNNNTVSIITAKREITCVSQLNRPTLGKNEAEDPVVLVCGFSDGTITSWFSEDDMWTEKVLVSDFKEYGRSVTDIGGLLLENNESMVVVSCSSGGADYHEFCNDSPPKKHALVQVPANALNLHTLQSGKTLILVGTAAPRHNKIHVFLYEKSQTPHYCGALTGHEDWITCFDWYVSSSVDYLASGSQDSRIRLWKFETETTDTPSSEMDTLQLKEKMDDDDDDDDEEEDGALEDKKEEGEARLEIFYENLVTSVFLEALLIGHEERITSVSWHPDPKMVYGQDLILISSSMDRTILIWSEHESGIWTPISRVGSAGGILGGSIGSSLLGFLNIQIEPTHGNWLLGHGYGGALHFFSCEQSEEIKSNTDMTIEERAAMSPWKALPCLTGHFDGVTDLCWEAESGSYLVTVSNDHTCRVWASAPTENEEAWIEIARPQVHGYNLSAITSLSTSEHPHMVVSGADEKELRIFDATMAFTRLLQLVAAGDGTQHNDTVERVERAYIPSLGLSNKATAADGAEEDTSAGVSESRSRLPLERDLGSVSLWPEVGKLYGHTSELARLASTVQARTCRSPVSRHFSDLLVASSAKARDVDTACIRIWDVKENRCVQVLTGGHRSTVVALNFSPDGRYLASSGKDRRLCLWERKILDSDSSQTGDMFSLTAAADSAHKRIVWSVHFCPFDPSVLASGSRDGSVKIWKLMKDSATPAEQNTETTMSEIFQFNPISKGSNNKAESVTALAFAPAKLGNMGLLALGLDNGNIELWKIPLESNEGKKPELVSCFPPERCHIATVTKLAWQPKRTRQPMEGKLILASCSSDHGCRLFEIASSNIVNP